MILVIIFLPKKLERLQYFGSVGGITHKQSWQMITPDKHGDWLRQRDDSFKAFLVSGDKKGHEKKIFEIYSCGLKTNRDAWVYNSSRKVLAKNMINMITFYNSEVERFNNAYAHADRKVRIKSVDNFVNIDVTKISWSSSLKEEIVRGKFSEFKSDCLIQSLYHPFTKQWLYYNRVFNHRVFQMPRICPMGQAVNNRVIQVTGIGASGFSVLMNKALPNLDTIEKGQCFPRYFYEDTESLKDKNKKQSHLFLISTEESKTAGLQRRDAIHRCYREMGLGALRDVSLKQIHERVTR